MARRFAKVLEEEIEEVVSNIVFSYIYKSLIHIFHIQPSKRDKELCILIANQMA